MIFPYAMLTVMIYLNFEKKLSNLNADNTAVNITDYICATIIKETISRGLT